MKKYNFKKDGLTIIKKAIDPKIADFVYNYFLMKKQVTETFFNTKYISPFEKSWGVLGDLQCPKSYSHYADIAMELLLLQALPTVEKHAKLKLSPTYSYARVYTQGDELKRHTDRYSCEVSATVNLGGSLWPIYIDPTGKQGQAGIKVDLKPGDMLIYKGDKLEHWREKFNEPTCVQVFLHYNSQTPGAEDNRFDGRPHLGLPLWFKGFKFT
jgi:hypothetical protein|tara:strand:- start:625 stop:1260 length:636 start_codon:yes stop_codon:yes gene_type:complete